MVINWCCFRFQATPLFYIGFEMEENNESKSMYKKTHTPHVYNGRMRMYNEKNLLTIFSSKFYE